MRLRLACPQGIVSRSQPRLYLIHDRYDELWLQSLKECGAVDRIEWLEISDVFDPFLPEVSRMFVTNASVPASVNVAIMLATVRSGLVTTPATAGPYKLARREYADSSRDRMNLADMHWKKDLDACRWTFRELGSELSRRCIAIVNPEKTARAPCLASRISGDLAAGNGNEHRQRTRTGIHARPAGSTCITLPPGQGRVRGVMAVYGCEVASVAVTRMVPTRVTAPPRIMVEVIFSFNVREEISTPRKGSK